MKKILTILGCVILFAATSCTKQYVSPATTNQTFSADLATSAWTLYTDQSGVKSYAATINISSINNSFVQYGGIIVDISYDGGSTYEQLPETYAGIAYSFTYNAGNPGNVTLYAQSSDGTTAVQPTLPIHVKVILVDSN
jgi:opacity protein-like surface antigen